ncbi:four helix bundle protein [Flavobacteriaceae bacterium MAR_2010_188]|nr:four helix bundle protein [Flavobacteriaceae bacterium MAR_2010_188]
MSEIKTFEDLQCWIKSRELRLLISDFIKSLPEEEKFDLISQMRRAARSITHNIAEGYGRYHFKENAQFCRISRGSLYELLDQTITASDEGYMDEKRYKQIRESIFDCVRLLNGYINYLTKSAK